MNRAPSSTVPRARKFQAPSPSLNTRAYRFRRIRLVGRVRDPWPSPSGSDRGARAAAPSPRPSNSSSSASGATFAASAIASAFAGDSSPLRIAVRGLREFCDTLGGLECVLRRAGRRPGVSCHRFLGGAKARTSPCTRFLDSAREQRLRRRRDPLDPIERLPQLRRLGQRDPRPDRGREPATSTRLPRHTRSS